MWGLGRVKSEFYRREAYRMTIGSMMSSHSLPTADPERRLRVNISLCTLPPRRD